MLPEKEARVITSQVCAGLAYLNEAPRRIIHYDLKPANIMFDGYGQVKLTVRSAHPIPCHSLSLCHTCLPAPLVEPCSYPGPCMCHKKGRAGVGHPPSSYEKL